MEQLIYSIEAYAARCHSTPQSVLRKINGTTWRQWELWKNSIASPTVRNADKIYAYMAANPPSSESAE